MSRAGSLVINSGLPPISAGGETINRMTPSRRNLVPRSTSLGLGANTGTLPLFHTEGVSVDEKLNEQFRYFRSEYVEAANTSGVAVPMAIVEDKSGQVYKFVYHGGPKYLFEVIQANLENIHLLRCSFSLLIIIITLLRRKLPDSGSHREPSNSLFSSNTSDSITAWVADTLAKIGDASAVSVCINVLITSYNPSVQELALSLLSSMLMVSDEAVAQMLLPYSSSGTVAAVDTSNDTARRNSGKRSSHGRPSTIDIPDGTQAIEAQPPSPSKNKHKDFQKLNFSYNHMDYSSSKKFKVEKAPKVDRPSTCLSYVLSVILLQKNRHLMTAECASIVLAMLRKNRSEMCEAIAQTPTCELPAIDDRKSKNENRSSLSKYNAQPEDATAPTSSPLSNVIIEWAGLKLLLKFLFRFEKMNAQSKTTTKAIVRESVSASLHLKEEYAYAHGKVFSAVCQLIAGSPAVAAQTNKLEGAEDLLNFTFSRFDPNDSAMYNSLVAATNALAQDKQLQQRRRAQLYAMEHGGRLPPSGADGGGDDLRLSEYLMSEGGEHQTLTQPNDRAVTPKELYNRIHGKTPTGSVSPSRSTNATLNKNNRKNNKKAMQVSASADARLGSLPRKEVHSNEVEIGRNFKVNFQSEYQVETEKGELYLLNAYDSKYGGNAGELKAMSKQADRITAHTPLSYHPDVDQLIPTSLDSITAQSMRPITDPRPQMTEQQMRETEFLLGTSTVSGTAATSTAAGTVTGTQSQSQSHVAGSLSAPSVTSHDSSSYPGRMGRAGQDEEVEFIDSLHFFSSLPRQPVIPTRIEPKDVITEMEDLAVIRKKFQQMAETARNKSNGKIEGSRDSQQEKIRRVYGPRKFKFFDPRAPSPQYTEDGELIPMEYNNNNNRTDHSRSRSPSNTHSRSARNNNNNSGGGGGRGIAPIAADGDYFASFSDASGTAFQDMPIQPNAGGGGRDGGGDHMYGMEGMDFSVDHLAHFSLNHSSATSDGPDIYGLRLENFDFDEQNLFDGFKPIFGNATGEKDKSSKLKPAGPDQNALDELGIGRKNKPDMEMVQTVDLILS